MNLKASELFIFLACFSFLVILGDLAHMKFSTRDLHEKPITHLCFLYGTCNHENITNLCGHWEVIGLVVPVCCELLFGALTPTSIHSILAYPGGRLLWVMMCIHSASC